MLLHQAEHREHSMHCMAQHGTAQHSTARRGAARHGTARHSTAQHSTAQYSMLLPFERLIYPMSMHETEVLSQSSSCYLQA